MKVLLINPPEDLEAFLGKGKNFVPSFEPLGLLYICAVCKQHGHQVYVIDAVAERLSCEDIKNTIAKMGPDVVGVTSFVCNAGIIYSLGRWIKQEYPHITVVFGNVQAAVYAGAYLKNKCCDIVVHGEGEYVFLKILEVLEKKENDFSNIPSISYLKDNKYVANSEIAFIDDLTKLPLPDRDAVNQRLYNMQSVTNTPYAGRKNSIGKHMFTSRGCQFSCFFCVVHNKKGLRCNSIANVVDEMEVLVKKYAADYIFIADPIFASNKERVVDICKEIKNRHLNFRWGCEGHINLVDQEMAEAMEAAGCYDMGFGIESGVQRLLDRVNKMTRIETIEKTIRIVKKSTKIKVSGLFILGLPGETYQDSLKTIGFAKRLPLDMAQFSILVPYPGSPLFYELREKGEIDAGLGDEVALDRVVWQRYSPYISFTRHDPVWVTPDLTAEKLKKLQKKALREFYFRPKQFWTQLRRVHLSELWETIPTFIDTFFK